MSGGWQVKLFSPLLHRSSAAD